MNSNYTQSLAHFLFKKLVDHQTNPIITQQRPKLYGSGFYFSERDLKEWIEEHDGTSRS